MDAAPQTVAAATTAADDDTRPDAQINHSDAKAYWGDVPADIQGMLGGYPQVSRVDLQGSRAFLAKLGISTKSKSNSGEVGGSIGSSNGSGKGRRLRSSDVGAATEGQDGMKGEADGSKTVDKAQGRRIINRAVDCGAGIGRITEGLLLSIATQVDIVEPIAKFTDKLKDIPGVGKIWNVGLEEWNPVSTREKYDLIWNQWCLGHLTDEQLVIYLKSCREAAVVGGGLVVVKENITTGERDVFDKEDSSVTRYVDVQLILLSLPSCK